MHFVTLHIQHRFLLATSVLFFALAALLLPSQTVAAGAAAKPGPVGKPVLIIVDVVDASQKMQPTIAGLAPQNTTIDVYINDKFVGNTGVSKNKKVIGHFAFRLPKPLPRGSYKVTAVTRHVDKNKKTTYSEVSKPFTLHIPTAGVKDVRPVSERGEAAKTSPAPAAWPNVQPATPAATVASEIPKEAGPAQEPVQEQSGPEESSNSSENTEQQAEIATKSQENGGFPLTTLQIIGWAALLTAAGLFVYQVRRHRQDIDMALEEPLETSTKKTANNTENTEEPQS